MAISRQKGARSRDYALLLSNDFKGSRGKVYVWIFRQVLMWIKEGVYYIAHSQFIVFHPVYAWLITGPNLSEKQIDWMKLSMQGLLWRIGLDRWKYARRRYSSATEYVII